MDRLGFDLQEPHFRDPTGGSQYNSVSVTVTYQWTPDLYITGPLNLTSTSVMPMSY